MITHMLHTMTPDDVSVLKQKLASDLQHVPAHEFLVALCVDEFFQLSLSPLPAPGLFHVLWVSDAHVQRDAHAQVLENLPRWVGEDGEGALRYGFVVADQGGRAAADHDDTGRDGHGAAGFFIDGFYYGFDVGAACLDGGCRVSEVTFS